MSDINGGTIAAKQLLAALFRRGRSALATDLQGLEAETFHLVGDRPVFITLTEVADQAPVYGNFSALLSTVTEHLLNTGQLENHTGTQCRKSLEAIASSTVDESQVPVLLRAALLERIDRGARIMSNELKEKWPDMPVDQRGPWLAQRSAHMYALLERYQNMWTTTPELKAV